MTVRRVGEALGALFPGEFFNYIIYLVGCFGQYDGAEPQAAIWVFSEFTIEITRFHGVPG